MINGGSVRDRLGISDNVTKEGSKMSVTGYARVLLVGSLVGAMVLSLAPPGLSREKGTSQCPRFTPVEPESESKQTSSVPDTKVLAVGAGATSKDPMVVDLELGLSVWAPSPANPAVSSPVMEDTKFINLQVAGPRTTGLTLNSKLVWDSPRQLNDLDMLLFNSEGKELDRSDRPTGQPETEEFISFAARGCEGFTVEVRGYRTLPTSATLQVWLSRGPSQT